MFVRSHILFRESTTTCINILCTTAPHPGTRRQISGRLGPTSLYTLPDSRCHRTLCQTSSDIAISRTPAHRKKTNICIMEQSSQILQRCSYFINIMVYWLCTYVCTRCMHACLYRQQVRPRSSPRLCLCYVASDQTEVSCLACIQLFEKNTQRDYLVCSIVAVYCFIFECLKLKGADVLKRGWRLRYVGRNLIIETCL